MYRTYSTSELKTLPANVQVSFIADRLAYEGITIGHSTDAYGTPGIQIRITKLRSKPAADASYSTYELGATVLEPYQCRCLVRGWQWTQGVEAVSRW